MQIIAFLILGGIILFLIITWAVKIGIKEAYFDLKEDLIKELKEIKSVDPQPNSNDDKQ